MNLTASVVSAFISSHLFMLGLIVAVLVFELILSTYLQQLKSSYERKQVGLSDESEIEELSIEYYSRKQRVSLLRAGTITVALLVGLVVYDVRAITFIALAVGASVLVFKESINSIISYFHILSNYHVGDDVSVLGVRGEVLHIRPLVTTILGKNDDGEYNGRVTAIPNYQFTWTPVERMQMKSNSYMLVKMNIPFESSLFKQTFAEFVKDLRAHLDEMLPRRTIKKVGYFRSYVGYRYKIEYSYDLDARIILHITFVSQSKRIPDRKERIIDYVESCKK
ncbi:MAG TPA: hypothetical protein VJ579_00135 [Candidatus Paceibacterota bacterium]|nr:hypothetical protein [Candidatus Paceibacterota bacterium]